MKLAEITSIKPLTPEKARIDALKKQKERASDALKAERDRQERAKAVDKMRDAQQQLLKI